MLACGTLWPLPWGPQRLSQLAAAPAGAILALIYLGLFPGFVADVTWMVAIGELGAPKAANLLFFMAPTAAALSIPLVGVWPSRMTILGGAVALVGVLIVHRRRQG